MAAAVAAGLCWTAAIQAARAEQLVETRPIDKTFHIIKVRRENRPTGFYNVFNYVKAEQRGDQLMVCGGYAGELTNITAQTYADALRNHLSYLIVGAKDDASAPRLSGLGFMAENRTASPQLESMKAACVLTDYRWDPKYATSRFYMSTADGRGY